MRGAEFAELMAFVAIADRGSFVKGAAVLGVSTSTLSQTIRTLEERLGVRLLNRTTRSLALTDAGKRLIARVRPALEELGTAIEVINDFRDTPAGMLRLNVSSCATGMVIAPVIGRFRAEYPAITLDITVDDSLIDIVGGRFDAGVRPARHIPRDMIALRISPESRLIAIASPDYLATHPRPKTPKDLHAHNCIGLRQTTGALYRWGFEKAGEELEVSVEGSLITNGVDLMVRAALDGVGIGYMLEDYVAPLVAEGRLVAVLEDWSLRFSGFHIYYPSRRQMPASLKAFIQFLRTATRPKAQGSDLAIGPLVDGALGHTLAAQ